MIVTRSEYNAALASKTPEALTTIANAGIYGIVEDTVPSPRTEHIVDAPAPMTQSPQDDTPEYLRAIEEEKERLANDNARIAMEREESARRVHELELRIAGMQASQMPPATQNTDDFDIDRELDKRSFDNDYDRLVAKTDLMAEMLKKAASSPTVDPRITEFLAEREGEKHRLEEERKRLDDLRTKELIQRNIEDFWKSMPDVAPGCSVNEFETQVSSFKGQLINKLGSEKEADKTMALLANPATEKSTINKLAVYGIQPPENFHRLYETVRVFDYMNGYVTNEQTGERVDVIGKNGNVQILGSLDDAYFLMNKNKLTINARRTAMKELAEFMAKKNSGATTIPNHQYATVPSIGGMSPERAQVIFAEAQRNPAMFQRDPNRAKELAEARAFVSTLRK
jgi:hypothetical protein